MKAISLWQPWASAVAIGLKKVETRGRRTLVRGRIAIHAAQKRSREQRCKWWRDFGMEPEIIEAFEEKQFLSATPLDQWEERFEQLPFGAIIATVELVDCIDIDDLRNPDGAPYRMKISYTESLLGNYGPGRFAWRFENVERLKEPVPCRGRQGWFDVDL